MRESLTILAILLIVVLTTALVGPYFVDWNAHRAQIEARLSDLLGAKVTVAGPIDVRLLPRPIFKLQTVRVVGATPRDGLLSIDRLDTELALTALLRGQINFVDADLTRPHLTLAAGADRAVVLPKLESADPDHVSLDRIAIHDGRFTLAGRGAPDLVLTGVNGEGGAESLAGPFRFAGHVDTPRGPLALRVATAAYENGRVRLKASLDPVAGSPRTDVEGTLTTRPAPDRASALVFDGSVVASGSLPLAATRTAIPWQVTSRVKAEPGRVEASGAELRAGADGRAVVADGDGRWASDADGGVAHLTLRAREINVTKLATPPPGGDAPAAPTAADYVEALKRFATDADAFAAVPVPVALDVSAKTVTIGAETLTGLEAAVTVTAGKPATGRLAVAAPEGTSVSLDGTFEPGPAAVFKGRADASTRDLGRLATALAPDLPDAAAALQRSLPAVKSLGFTGALDLSAVGFAAQDATLDLDRSRFTGTFTLTRAVGTDRARFFADVVSDALDLDALPDWRAATAALSGTDLSVSLAARAVQIARTDLGPVDAGRITLQLNKTGPAVTLDRLILADLGGATADLTGHSDGSAAHLEGRFDARKLHDLAGLLRRIAPSPLTAGLEARADALSPALFKVSGDAAVGGDGTLAPTGFALDGTAAGTVVALHLKPVPTPPAEPGDPPASVPTPRAPITLGLSLDAPEAGALLRQIGLATLPATAIGRGHLDAGVRVGGAGALDSSLSLSLGSTTLTVRGRGTADDATGHVAVRGPNVAPVLRALALATPEAGAAWPVDAEADVTLRGGRIATRGLAGQVVGTAVSGDLAYTLPAPDPAPPASGAVLTGAVAFDRLPLSALAGLALGPLPPPKPGAAWPDSPLAPPVATPPRSELTVAARSLPLTDAATARDARLTLRLAPGVVTIADLAARLGDGTVGGTLTLRRDGPAASLSGHVDWSGWPLATPALGGQTRGALDLAGTGNSFAVLVAGLAGNGTLTVADARLPRFDPGAISRVVAAVDAATGPLEPDAVAGTVDDELGKGALALGTVTVPVTAATGVLRAAPATAEAGPVTAEVQGSLDLRTLALTLRATATARALPSDWSGEPPRVGVQWTGPFASPARKAETATLVNGLAARAITRDQARIDAFQDDVRERAFFARRLRAIEEEQAAKAAAGRPSLAKPASKASDGISQLLEGLKPPPAVPRPRVVPKAGGPLDLQRPPPPQAGAPSNQGAGADPSASGPF